MNTRPMSLEQVQREMAASVMMPLTAEEDMRPSTLDGRSMADVAGSFIAPNSRLSSFERLEIYNRQYWFRVLNALAEDFTALRSLVGSRRFHQLSVAYLVEHPSRSFTLRNLGYQLVDFVAAHPEFAGRRHALAIDVARVEWAFIEAFDHAEHAPLTTEQIATLDGDSKLSLQPHVRLLELQYSADELVIALHAGDERQTSEAAVQDEEPELQPVRLPKLRRRITWVAAHRVDYAVYYRRLTREEFLTLQSIRDGATLSSALEAGFAASLLSGERQIRKIKEWFGVWAELGWICAPELESLIRS